MTENNKNKNFLPQMYNKKKPSTQNFFPKQIKNLDNSKNKHFINYQRREDNII